MKIKSYEPVEGQLKRWRVVLVDHTVHKELPTIHDYNPWDKAFNNQRKLVIHTDLAQAQFEAWLTSHPDSCLYNKVSHNPMPLVGVSPEECADRQLITFEGEPYLDMTGNPVYLQTCLSWERAADVDMRFPGNMYPADIPGEFEDLFK